MEKKTLEIEVFTFTDMAQNKLSQLGFTEVVVDHEQRGVRSYDICLSHEKFSEVHLYFTEVLDEELFRSYEIQRQIQEKLLFKPRIIVRKSQDVDVHEQKNKSIGLSSLSPLHNHFDLVRQVVHQQYGFIVAQELSIGHSELPPLKSNAHLQMICIHQKLMAQELLAEDLIEVPYFLIDEKNEASLYFQLRKESACVALVLDHPRLKNELKDARLPEFQIAGTRYWHIKENPLDFDLLIPIVE